MDFLSNKTWVRIFLGHPVQCLDEPEIFAINTNFVEKLKKFFMIYTIKRFFSLYSRDTLFAAFVLLVHSACEAQKWRFFVPLFFINPYCSVEISGCILFLILSMITWSITLVTWLIIEIVRKF